MPIYEYACSDCPHRFESLQKLSDPILTICPKCGHNSLSKLISATSFQLKGTGWYKTDFKDSMKPTVSTSVETTSNSEKPPVLT